MKTILTVVGARPQFIKAATVSRVLAGRRDVCEFVVHTGQHSDANMSGVFFEELGVPRAAVFCGVKERSHGAMTGKMLMAVEEIIATEKPDMVLVYGDTNSTLAGALAAAKIAVPVAHVEAGLRSFNRAMPEEINRIVTDHVSALLFCPTTTAKRNLASEGIRDGVFEVGDVMYDATLATAEFARKTSTILARLNLVEKGYGVATLHRAETTDDPQKLQAALDYLRSLTREQPIVFPLHPRTRQAVAHAGSSLEGLTVCEPLGYIDMHRLLASAAVVATDSGGLQKEAYFHRVPCITLRGETEWVETIECGWNRLWNSPDYAPRREIAEYGDGHASEKIAAILTGRLA